MYSNIIARKIVEWCDKDCTKEEFVIYSYGIELFLNNSLKITVFMILGVSMGIGVESLIFFGCFCTLRAFFGGFHAKTDLGCLIITGVSWGINTTLCKVISINNEVWLFALIAVNLFVVLLNLYKGKETGYRKKAYGILILNFWLCVCLLSAQFYRNLILTTVCTVILLMLPRRRIYEEKRN